MDNSKILNKINYICAKLSINSPNKNCIIITKEDSGVTYYYICQQDEACLKNTTSNSTIKVTLSNTQAILSTTQVILSLHQFILK